MAELDYGERSDWFIDTNDRQKQLEWCQKYIVPYMQIVKVEKLNNTVNFILYFSDGSSVGMSKDNGRDWFFFPGDPKKCLASNSGWKFLGKCGFAFIYNPILVNGSKQQQNWDFTAYGSSDSRTKDDYYSNSTYGCNSNSKFPGFCTGLIQYNGWEIPADYPFRVHYR